MSACLIKSIAPCRSIKLMEEKQTEFNKKEKIVTKN